MSRLLERLRKLDDLAKATKESEGPKFDLSVLTLAELREMRGLVEKAKGIGTELTEEEKEHLNRLCEWCTYWPGRRPVSRAAALEAARKAEEAGEV
jgi:hypothetical protein